MESENTNPFIPGRFICILPVEVSGEGMVMTPAKFPFWLYFTNWLGSRLNTIIGFGDSDIRKYCYKLQDRLLCALQNK